MLGDSAEQPRYNETLPKLGYRFAPNVETETTLVEKEPLAGAIGPATVAAKRTAPWFPAGIALAIAIAHLLVPARTTSP